MEKNKSKIIDFRELAVFAAILIGIVVTQFYNYLLFHSFAELFAIIISLGIFVIGWNSRKYAGQTFFLVLGVSFLFVGIVDSLHTLAYKGMSVFTLFASNPSNLPTQLWIVARYIQAVSLLFALLYFDKKINAYYILFGYFVITTILITTVFLGIFPVAYFQGTGLTPFKITSEYVIDGLFFLALIWLHRIRGKFDHVVYVLIVMSIVIMMVSEVFFTLYVDVYGIFNLLGHVFKVVAFYFLYKAVIQIGIERPFDSLFRQLKQDQELLAQSAQECQQSNTELENFAYIASHDMQEPLRKVVSFMQLLQKRYAPQLDEKANEFIEIAIDGGTRMRQMISDLLDYSRVGTRGNPFVQADLEVILNEVLSDLVLLIEENGASITHDPLPSLVVDPIQMHQLFLNLLTNALKFRKEESPVVHISAIAQGNNYLFSVQDNGIGIDMTQAERLFQLFQRLPGRGNYPGTGIGLAVCKKIVERHGGQIWVESELEKGTTFYFTLPQSHTKVPKRE